MPPKKSPAKTPPKSASKKTPTKAADTLDFDSAGSYWSTSTDTPRSRRAASPAPKSSPAPAKVLSTRKCWPTPRFENFGPRIVLVILDKIQTVKFRRLASTVRRRHAVVYAMTQLLMSGMSSASCPSLSRYLARMIA